jgi:ribonuclease H2 subunit B
MEGDDGKKRKAKAKGSQGVEKLKKANLTGIAKISSFFQKK